VPAGQPRAASLAGTAPRSSSTTSAARERWRLTPTPSSEIEATKVAVARTTPSHAGGPGDRRLALEHFGTIDAVVSNAGVLRNANFEDLTVSNLNGCRRHLRERSSCSARLHDARQGYGRVVLTSRAGAFG
jgi:NAD(P)-dependent dehydrogenase (short-subunit alcohol dehydrogenase family)